jgi:hypothetical protein
MLSKFKITFLLLLSFSIAQGKIQDIDINIPYDKIDKNIRYDSDYTEKTEMGIRARFRGHILKNDNISEIQIEDFPEISCVIDLILQLRDAHKTLDIDKIISLYDLDSQKKIRSMLMDENTKKWWMDYIEKSNPTFLPVIWISKNGNVKALIGDDHRAYQIMEFDCKTLKIVAGSDADGEEGFTSLLLSYVQSGNSLKNIRNQSSTK